MDWKTIEMLANLSKKDKGELLKELVLNFTTEVNEHMDYLLQFFKNKEEHELEMLAHKFKGGGYTVGAKTFAETANKIETQAREGNLTGVEEHIAKLKLDFQYTTKEFTTYLTSLGKEIIL